MTGVFNLLPFTLPSGLRSDGHILLDLAGWVVLGRRPGWAEAPAPQDPHAATSVAPPG
jgi:hypothetical protein